MMIIVECTKMEWCMTYGYEMVNEHEWDDMGYVEGLEDVEKSRDE